MFGEFCLSVHVYFVTVHALISLNRIISVYEFACNKQ